MHGAISQFRKGFGEAEALQVIGSVPCGCTLMQGLLPCRWAGEVGVGLCSVFDNTDACGSLCSKLEEMT